MDALDDSFFERLVNVQSYSLEELTGLIEQLEKEETEISKQRRLLQGEIDILRAERERRLRDKQVAGESLVSAGRVDALAKILSERSSAAPGVEKSGTP